MICQMYICLGDKSIYNSVLTMKRVSNGINQCFGQVVSFLIEAINSEGQGVAIVLKVLAWSLICQYNNINHQNPDSFL